MKAFYAIVLSILFYTVQSHHFQSCSIYFILFHPVISKFIQFYQFYSIFFYSNKKYLNNIQFKNWKCNSLGFDVDILENDWCNYLFSIFMFLIYS